MKPRKTKFKMHPKYPHNRSEGTHPHRAERLLRKIKRTAA